MSLYLLLMIFSFGSCFVLSFDRKVAFYKNIRFLAPAIVIVAIPFLIWDQIFTDYGVWGFNEAYLQGFYIAKLPIEEVLFFFFIPYCCLFIYEVLIAYYPNASLHRLTMAFSIFLVLTGVLMALTHLNQWYTLSACSLTVLIVIFVMKQKYIWYPRAIFAFVVALIPFFVVNGILTGLATEEPIVWYNDSHNTGIRLFTIPLEDVFYNFSLLIPIIGIYHFLKTRSFQGSK
ncbi:MAG: lycopene cyclase domain-containing protein [Bacteroidota bacterium]|nr:lycopene cyclase domain-containing protein [Bacteroidota bacterium]